MTPGFGFKPRYSENEPWLRQKTMVVPDFSSGFPMGYGGGMSLWGSGYGFNSGFGSGWGTSTGWGYPKWGGDADSSLQKITPPLDNDRIQVTKKEATHLKEEQKEILAEENKKLHGSLGTNLAMGSVFCAGAIVNGAKVKKNSTVTKMFFEYDNVTKKAKYEKLWKDAPIAMREAQSEMAKANRKYLAEYKRLTKKGGADVAAKLNALDDDYLKLMMRMEDALKSGNPDEVAKAAERVKSANSVSYKKLEKINKKKNYTVTKETLARKANVKNIKAVKGNKLLSHAGGKLGIGMGIGSGLLMLGMDYSNIKEAYKIDTETGNKQLGQSCTKAAGMMLGYTAGDAIGRKAATKLLSKGVNKLAAKVAAKGAGKLIGMAVGSIVPGVGTIAGLIIGTALDYAISKWVVPAIWGENAVVDDKKIDKQSKKEALKEAYLNSKNGVQVSEETMRIIQKNPSFCAALDKQLEQEANVA